MKNLLVLFLVSFALFWVGCEKEEITISPQSTELKQQVQNSSDSNTRSNDQCCVKGTINLKRVYSSSQSGGGVVEVEFNDQECGNAIEGFDEEPFVNYKVIVNDNDVTPYFDFDLRPDCAPFPFTINEPVVVGDIDECPYTVKAIVTIFNYAEDTQGNLTDSLVICSTSFSSYQLWEESRNCPGNDFPDEPRN